MPQIYRPEGRGDEEERRRRRGGGDDSTPPPSGNTYSNVGSAERESKGTLPTGITWALAGITEDQKELRRATRIAARHLDIEPKFAFGLFRAADYQDPIYGGPLRRSTFQRFSNDFSTAAMAALIRGMSGEGKVAVGNKEQVGGTVRVRREVLTDIRPEEMAKIARSLGRLDEDLRADEALGIAASIAATGIRPNAFDENLAAVVKWAGTTGRQQNSRDQLAIAQAAASQNVKLRNPVDIAKFLAGPEVAKEYDKIVAAERARAAEAHSTTDGPALAGRLPATAQTLGAAQSESAQMAFHNINELAFAKVTDVDFDLASEQTKQAKDLFAQAEQIAKAMELEQSAFERSWFGVAAAKAGEWWDKGFKWAQEQIVNISTPLIGVGAQLGLVDITDPRFEDSWSGAFDWREARIQGFKDGKDLGTQFAEDVGAPSWVGTGLDFALAWFLDPTVVGGKFLSGVRAARVNPVLAEKLSIPGVVARKIAPGLTASARESRFQTFFNTVTSYSKSRQSKRLFNLAMKEDDGAAMLREIDFLRVNTESRTAALDHQYMKALRDQVKQLDPATRWDEWTKGVQAHFIGYAPEGSAARRAVEARIKGAAQSEDALRAMPSESFLGKRFKDADSGLLVPEATADDIIRSLDEGVETFAPFRFEVPRFRGVGARFGPRRAIRRAQTSQLLTRSALGRRLSRLGAINPGRMMNLERFADEYVYLHARRWANFAEGEARAFQAEALKILNTGTGSEERLLKLVEDINVAGFKKMVKPYQLGDQVEDDLYLAIFDPIRQRNARSQVFGVADDLPVTVGGKSKPIFESQNINNFLVADPVVVANQVQRVVGLPRRLRSHMSKNLKAFDPQARGLITGSFKKMELELQRRLIDDGVKQYRRMWKALTVARPGYIPRVILGEENARFLFVNQSLTERLIGQQVFGKAAGKTGLFKETIQIGDEVFEMPVPWKYAYEPLAANRVREVDILDDLTRQATLAGKAWDAKGQWRVIEPGTTRELQAIHLRAWNRALVQQIGNSGHGRFALESVAAGDNIATTTTKLQTWAREPHNFALLQQNLGIGADEIAEWADQVAKVTHAYTGVGAQREMARAILDGADDVTDVLKRVPLDDRPAVHGGLLEQVGAASPGAKWVDSMYKWFVRLPEDALNRQPFFRTWKARAERAYLAHFQEFYKRNPQLLKELREGVEAKIWPGGRATKYTGTTEQLEAALRAKSNQYFYHQTKADPAVLAESGITPKFRIDRVEGSPTFGQARPWESGTKEQLSFWAPDPEFSTFLSTVEAGPMLRVPRSAVPEMKPGVFSIGDDIPVEYISREPVAAKDIEFMGVDGQWHPLSDAAKTTKVPHDLTKAIDVSSTDFALERVKEIMYDFTRQSRFTELLSTFFPFPQPFFEGYQAWGHIVVQHPETLGRMRALFEAATGSGFVRRDENGEWTVPMGAWQTPGRLLHLMPERLRDSMNFTTPLQSFNMLTASTLRLSGEGLVGKIIGGVPIPVPGLAPEWMRLSQEVFKDSNNPAVASYLFAYGPKAEVVPRPIRALGYKLGLLEIPEERLGPYIGFAMKEYQRLGLDVDENGKKVPQATLVQWAKQDATALYEARELLSLVSPASLQPRLAFQAVQDEYNSIIEKEGWEKAQAWLEKNHPDQTLIGLSQMIAGKAYPGARAPKIPASEFVASMLADPDFGPIAKKFPEWMGLFLIGLDNEVVQRFDPATYSRLIADGWYKRKAPGEYWAQGEDSKVWREIDAYYKGIYNPQAAELEALGVDDQDDAWAKLRVERQEFFAALAQQFPDFARRNWTPITDEKQNVVGWDWPFDPDEVPFDIIYKDARMLTDIEELRNFPGVKALDAVLDGYDDIVADMREAGVSSTQYSSGEKYQQRWDKVKADAVKEIPELAPFLDNYLPRELSIDSQQKHNLRNLPGGVTGPRATAVAEFDTALEVATQNAIGEDVSFDFEWQQSQAWLDVRRTSEAQLKTNPQVVEDWWNGLTGLKKYEYRTSLMGRPTVFWSRWDWHVMGVDISDQAAGWMDEIAEQRVRIARREENDPAYSESAGFEAIDRFVKQNKGKDKTFDAVIRAMGDWTYPIAHAQVEGEDEDYVRLVDQPGRVGDAWKAVTRVMRDAQKAVDKAGLTGTSYGSDQEKRMYDQLQDELLDWVKSWHRYSPAFKRQWYQLQNEALDGAPIIGGLLVPDNYFGRIGDV